MRTYSQAVAFAEGQRRHPTQSWDNLCQAFSRQCVGADAWAASARLAYNAIPSNHKHSSTPPPAGSLVYYGPTSYGYGHVTFAIDNGYVYSNDILRRGKIDVVRWNTFEDAWGYRFRGWVDWTPSGSINLKSEAVNPRRHYTTVIGRTPVTHSAAAKQLGMSLARFDVFNGGLPARIKPGTVLVLPLDVKAVPVYAGPRR